MREADAGIGMMHDLRTDSLGISRPVRDGDDRWELESFRRLRSKTALSYAAVMIILLAAFILLVAFCKPILATRLSDGFTLALLLALLLIVAVVAMTASYTAWLARYDRNLRAAVDRETGDRR